jgi:hypothetical protein
VAIRLIGEFKKGSLLNVNGLNLIVSPSSSSNSDIVTSEPMYILSFDSSFGISLSSILTYMLVSIFSWICSIFNSLGVLVLIEKVNVLPPPSTDSTEISPSNASQIWRQMLRPRPIPLVLIADEDFSFPNILNSFS